MIAKIENIKGWFPEQLFENDYLLHQLNRFNNHQEPNNNNEWPKLDCWLGRPFTHENGWIGEVRTKELDLKLYNDLKKLEFSDEFISIFIISCHSKYYFDDEDKSLANLIFTVYTFIISNLDKKILNISHLPFKETPLEWLEKQREKFK